MNLTETELKLIHLAIHGFRDNISLRGQTYPIEVYFKNGCRYTDIQNIRFMEQNKVKCSKFATKARAGALITWGMRGDAPWIYIETEATQVREYPYGDHTLHHTKVLYNEDHRY